MNNILDVLDKVIAAMKKEIDSLKQRNNELYKEIVELENKIEKSKKNAKSKS